MDEEVIDVEEELLKDEEEDNDGNATAPRKEYAEFSTKFTTDQTSLSIETLQQGIPNSFLIIDHTTIPPSGFTQSQIDKVFSPEDITRLKLQPTNVTIPAALLMLYPEQFTSQTRARKDTRRRKILVHRGPLVDEGEDNGGGGKRRKVFDREKLLVGKVGDRVGPGDTLAVQTRMSHNYGESKKHHDDPPFHLPVVYQDDHFAIVNKPEGKIVFSHKNGGYGRDNVKSALPWFLTPPTPGVVSVMRRPNPVHRIDKGTSGLLVCAKTKPAMVELARMFKERIIKKTYTAIVSGKIEEPKESSITSQEATNLGVCIDGHSNNDDSWQIIDEELEGQSAVTIWRVLKQWPLENARNDTASLVELKPKTGRYHQLRRHMAWVRNCPLLGDKQYDGGGLAKTLRDQGFYLCSNRVTLEHPYYNTPQGRREWDAKKSTLLGEQKRKEGGDVSSVRITEEEDGVVLVHCEIDLPAKFSELSN